jgi:hypothetical protein
MGFIDTAPGTNLPVFFNVIHAVGKNCPNVRDDVKLIQFLLMAFYDRQPNAARPKGDIAVTGFCGGATMNWILKFQLDMHAAAPGKILLDNRVDRIRDKTRFVGSISKTVYTLAFLNVNVAATNPQAFIAVPTLIPLENPLNVPPPTLDTIKEILVPATGGV